MHLTKIRADARQSGRAPQKMKLTAPCLIISVCLPKKKKRTNSSCDFMQVIVKEIKYKHEAILKGHKFRGKFEYM